MSAIFEGAKAILNKSLPSWTIWLGLVWAILSGLPDVLVTVVGWFGEVTPELTAKVVAVSLLIARARSIVQPVVEGLLGKK
jgi:hypothetical protein